MRQNKTNWNSVRPIKKSTQKFEIEVITLLQIFLQTFWSNKTLFMKAIKVLIDFRTKLSKDKDLNRFFSLYLVSKMSSHLTLVIPVTFCDNLLPQIKVLKPGTFYLTKQPQYKQILDEATKTVAHK